MQTNLLSNRKKQQVMDVHSWFTLWRGIIASYQCHSIRVSGLLHLGLVGIRLYNIYRVSGLYIYVYRVSGLYIYVNRVSGLYIYVYRVSGLYVTYKVSGLYLRSLARSYISL